jgi:biotin carboxyl carrier protein
MRYIARTGGRQFSISLPENGHRQRITLDGKEHEVELTAVGVPGTEGLEGDGPTHFGLLVGTCSRDVYVRSVPSGEDGSSAQTFEVSIAGRTFTIALHDERTSALMGLAGEGHAAGDASIRAPMPGLVSNVLAAEGASVQRGQTIVVLEAMKMENDLTSPRAGIVKSLRVAKGQTVNQGDVLAVVGEPAGTAAPEEDEWTA